MEVYLLEKYHQVSAYQKHGRITSHDLHLKYDVHINHCIQENIPDLIQFVTVPCGCNATEASTHAT